MSHQQSYYLLPPQMGNVHAPYVEQVFVGYETCCADGDPDLLAASCVVRATQMLSSAGLLAVELLAVQHVRSRQELIDAEYKHDCETCRERRAQVLEKWDDEKPGRGGFLILIAGAELAQFVQAAHTTAQQQSEVDNVHPIGGYL